MIERETVLPLPFLSILSVDSDEQPVENQPQQQAVPSRAEEDNQGEALSVVAVEEVADEASALLAETPIRTVIEEQEVVVEAHMEVIVEEQEETSEAEVVAETPLEPVAVGQEEQLEPEVVVEAPIEQGMEAPAETEPEQAAFSAVSSLQVEESIEEEAAEPTQLETRHVASSGPVTTPQMPAHEPEPLVVVSTMPVMNLTSFVMPNLTAPIPAAADTFNIPLKVSFSSPLERISPLPSVPTFKYKAAIGTFGSGSVYHLMGHSQTYGLSGTNRTSASLPNIYAAMPPENVFSKHRKMPPLRHHRNIWRRRNADEAGGSFGDPWLVF